MTEIKYTSKMKRALSLLFPIAILVLLIVATVYFYSIATGKQSHDEPDSEYRGYLVSDSAGIKVYVMHDSEYGVDDVYTEEMPCLIRYINEHPVDTMQIVGPYTRVDKSGKNRCAVIVGTDSIVVGPGDRWPAKLDVRFHGMLPGYKTYRLSQHYALNDSSPATDFQLNVAMNDATPLWIRNFISRRIAQDGFEDFALWDYDDEPAYTPVVFDMAGRSVAEMMRFYYDEFRHQYYKTYYRTEDDEPSWGNWYSYKCYIYPVWQSVDGNLVTWRFYSFQYYGGAYGFNCDFFLTFDCAKQRIIGLGDLYDKERFAATEYRLKMLINGLNDYQTFHDADLGPDSITVNEWDRLVMDTLGGRFYPRPALTDRGVVFSYQTTMDCAPSDGALHFTLPVPDGKL